MKSTKQTKRALISSAISLLLCFAMLLGTTFAWFTDSVSSGVNTIKAGNLDIEVDYKVLNEDGTVSDNWAPLDGSQSLFSSNLWEPGHTEVVYLRVTNKGTLALNYKVLVTPVTENGGVNVAGNSFKLSDSLVFGTTEATTTAQTYDRNSARAAVGTTTGLADVNSLTKTGTMVGKTDANTDVQYMALVVYMPETVGNEANYKTGTAAPTIELGINVVATQKTAELDSYGPDYDGGAVTDSFYTVGSYYDYFPQVSVSAPVAQSGDTVITATGKLNSSDTENTTLAKVTVPEGVQLEPNTSELTVKVVPKAPAESTTNGLVAAGETANNGRETANFDIKVVGVASDNTADIKVEAFVGKGLANVKVYHNGSLINGTNYDPSTGIVTFTTKGFSDFTAAFDVATAAIGTQTYGTLELAVAAAQNGATITLLKDSAGNGIGLYATPKNGQTKTKDLTIDFNGFTYTIGGTLVGSPTYESQAFHLEKDCAVTLKNGTLTTTNATMLIQNYCNLTLDNMTLSAPATCSYVMSNNNGEVVINNTTINAAEGKVAFDVYSFGSYTGANVTVTGNSVINGKIEVGCDPGANTSNLALKINSGTINGNLAVNPDLKHKVSISGGTFSADPSAYVAPGYTAKQDGDVWKIYHGDVLISNADELVDFAKAVNNEGKSFAGKTVALIADIDLSGIIWTPVGQTGGYTAKTYFQGTFDGNGFTISNLNVPASTWEAGSNEGKNFASGFFGFIDAGGNTIKNVTFANATVEGHHWVGVAAGYMTGTVSGVKVINSTVTSTYKTGEADGDKAGGVVGYLNSGSVTGCTVTGSTITAVRDCGSVVGYSVSGTSVTGNTAENCYVYYSTDNDAQIGGAIAGKRANGVSNNTATNVTVAKKVVVEG